MCHPPADVSPKRFSVAQTVREVVVVVEVAEVAVGGDSD